MNNNLVLTTAELKADMADTLDILRSETALSRYPVHNLSTGNIAVEIKKKDDKGLSTLLWKVSYNSEYGQPGQRAYKLDTLIVNRRIDELRWGGRPVPKLIRLGSLTSICEELGITVCGKNKNDIKTALLQNASAFITVKGIRYEATDETERSLDAAFTRYSVISTGEKLPNGLKADAVFLILNDIFMEIINSAKTRPLDYDYLCALPPAAQRFYEIVSYKMLPAVRYNQRAKLAYSDFCMLSTMTRYFDFDHVKKQMWSIHKPHTQSGYISKVEYEPAIDEEGQPDWNMFYVPGERAKFQQLVFSFAHNMARTERPKRAHPTPKINKATTSNSELPLAEKAPPPPSTETMTLIMHFYRLRFGQEKSVTQKEMEQAATLISEGAEWAAYLVEHAARYGKEQPNGFPENFGGVTTLAAKFRTEYEATAKKRETARLEKARKSHEEAYTGDYKAFLGEILRGRLESTLPEAFSTFKDEEDRIRTFFKGRSTKSERAAKDHAEFDLEEQRVERLLRFIESHPKCGIPDFWQWDEKINPERFP